MNDRRTDQLTRLEEETLLAMRLGGELAPECAAEVDSAEGNWDPVSEEDLPESLRNPVALAAKIVESEDRKIIDIAPSVFEQQVEAELARAARFGRSISKSVEQRMKEDKEHAREEFEKGPLKSRS
jgi:hypothetical protein